MNKLAPLGPPITNQVGATERPVAPPKVDQKADPKVDDGFERGATAKAEAADDTMSVVKDHLAKGLHAIADPFIISALINTAGTAIVHFAFGVPVDLKIAATFQVVGTTIGASYFPLKAMIESQLSPKKPPTSE